MTSSTRYLNRDEVARVEPSEGDAHSRTSLSPYAIPTAVEFQVNPAKGWEIVFRYYDDLEAAAPTSMIAGGPLPPIKITVAVHTRKVLKLSTTPPTSPEDLPTIAAVLEAVADSLPRVAERMSYRLTAQILRMIDDDISRGDRRALSEQ